MKAQTKVLILLCSLLIIFVAFALCPSNLSSAIDIKHINLTSLTKKPERPLETNSTTSDTIKVPQKKEKDNSPQNILFIGDSMLEGLARRLVDYTEANGHTQHTIIWYSSTSEKWATTKTLDHYIEKYKPTYIIVCLCSNELFVRDLDDRDKYIKTIISKIGNIPYTWISPPNWKEDTGINQVIIDNIGMERYFDSRDLDLPRGKDHAHPTFNAAKIWFDAYALWVGSDSTIYPIKMDKPEKEVKLNNIVVLQPDFDGESFNN